MATSAAKIAGKLRTFFTLKSVSFLVRQHVRPWTKTNMKALTIAANTTEQIPAVHPQYYRLPKPGRADCFFGLSRSFYYSAEARGWLKLVRIRAPGKTKGVTLIPFADVAAFVRSHVGSKQNSASARPSFRRNPNP